MYALVVIIADWVCRRLSRQLSRQLNCPSVTQLATGRRPVANRLPLGFCASYKNNYHAINTYVR